MLELSRLSCTCKPKMQGTAGVGMPAAAGRWHSKLVGITVDVLYYKRLLVLDLDLERALPSHRHTMN